jgi:hypothetical protein
VSTAGTVPRGDSTPGEAHPPRRVVLLSESAGLATVLGRLLDRRDQLTRIGWPREVAEQGELDHADLVVLDVPDADRIAAVDQLRRRYRGPVVVFVERGDDGRRLPPDPACTLLARPFSADELRAALGLSEPGTGQERATPGGTRDAAARRPAPTLSAPLPAAKRPRPGAPAAPGAADAPAALAGKAPTLVAPPAGTGRVVSLFPAPAVDDRAARRPSAPAERQPVAQEAAVVEIPAAPMEGRPALGEDTAPATGARPAAPGRAPAAGPTAAVVDGPRAPVDDPPAPVDGKAAARPAPPRPGVQPGATPPEPPRRNRLAAVVAGIADGWRTRRAVRIAGFAGLATVAFMVAFVWAAQGRCGPGCDPLTGIITPARTLPAARPPAPTTTPRKPPPPSTTLPPSGDGYQGVVPGGALASTTSTTRRAATTATTTRRATSTTRKPPPPSSATTTSTTTTSTTTTTTTTPPATP